MQAQRGAPGPAPARRPEDIGIGRLVRETEPNFHLVECFDSEHNTCPIVPVCGLIRPLAEAQQAFLSCLDRYTLADALTNKEQLIPLWGSATRGADCLRAIPIAVPTVFLRSLDVSCTRRYFDKMAMGRDDDPKSDRRLPDSPRAG